VDLLEIVEYFNLEKFAVYVLAFRAFFKPFFSWWNKKVAPYIEIRPSEKLLRNPIYKSAAYLIDWALSIKLPKAK